MVKALIATTIAARLNRPPKCFITLIRSPSVKRDFMFKGTGLARKLIAGSLPMGYPAAEQDMNCPNCAVEMKSMIVEAHLAPSETIDLCQACQGFWFDKYEDLKLAPASTLNL